MIRVFPIAILTCFLLIGCEPAAPPAVPKVPIVEAKPAAETPAAPPQNPVSETVTRVVDENDRKESAEEKTQETKPKPPAAPGGETRASEVIVGGSGFNSMSASIERTQIVKAMADFQALNERYPKDHQEFMDQIIKANNIKLPVLPADKKYQYSPDRHELMVAPK